MSKKHIVLTFSLILIISILTIKFIDLNNNEFDLAENEQLRIFVSILPQKFFVNKIGGDHVDVSVLVGPGQNPATYEPLPKQMGALSESALYFRIGVPFETSWHQRIRDLNPNLKIVDTREGITLRSMEGSRGEDNKNNLKDPHIWLDPLLVKVQAETIYRELSDMDPKNRNFYEENLLKFQAELDQLDKDLSSVFATLPVGKLMVFHPAWGYLFERYNLLQIPIEIEGKEPGPRELTHLVELAQREEIKVIFIEEQFDTTTAISIAEAIGGKVVKLDPLSEDYFSNLRQIAKVIREEH